MMDILAGIEASALATWVRESGSIWAYPTVLFVHTLGLSLLVGANVALDLRLLGLGSGIPVSELGMAFPTMWTGFTLNAVSGVLLFIADATVKATQPVFMIKLALIFLGVLNIVMLRRRWMAGAVDPAGVATPRAKFLASTSLVIWAGAITAGRLMAYL
jgi:hypothetical protein